MRIGIVGCGGIGTNVISSLSRGDSENRELVLVDGDHFEESNLSRQIFNADALGVPKVTALQRMYPKLVTGTASFFLYNEGDVNCALKGCDFVFILPDNNRARELVMDWCMTRSIPFIVAGNEEFSSNAVYWSPDISRLTDGNFDPFLLYPEYRSGDGMRQSCQEVVADRPQTAHANEMAAMLSIHLFYFWTSSQNDLPDEVLKLKALIEYLSTRIGIQKRTISSINLDELV